MTAGRVSPWPGEDYVCTGCGTRFAEIDLADVADTILALAAEIRALVTSVAPDDLARRPVADRWSVIEYLCHVRDVYEASTIRLHRARVEQSPQLEPMYNDLRARRFRYADRDPAAVLDELDAAVAGCIDELARVVDADRTVTRLAGEHRTVRWLARTAVHEGRHHLGDLRATVHQLSRSRLSEDSHAPTTDDTAENHRS